MATQSPQPQMRTFLAKRAFAGGGGAKKTVQQMADELMMKGTKVADKPDLARRSLFGLKAQPTMDFPLAKLEKHLGKEGKAPTLTEKTTTVSPDAGATKSTLKSITETPISRRTVLKSAAGQALQGMMPESLMSPPSVAGLVESAVEAAPAASLGRSAIPGLMAKLMRQGMSPEEAGREVEKMIPNVLIGWPEIVGERIAAPADRLPFVGKESPLMSIFGEMIKPASRRGPYSLRPEMRGLRELSPEDYDLLKQTARDVKEYGFESERAFAGGGGVKKTVQQMADELMTKGTKVADKPDLARRSLFGLKAQPAIDFPLARIDDKALTRLEKEFGKEGKAPTLTEKTTTVSPDAGATKSTLKSITETPISRRTLLKSAAGQALQGMLPMGELSALGRVASPAAYVAEVVKPAVTPAMIPGLVAKFIKEGMSEEDAVKRVVNEFASHYRHSPAQVKELRENLDYVDLPNRLEFPEADLESMTDDLTSPSGAWNYLTGLQDLIPKDISYGELKQSMRHLRDADPDAYARMRSASKDFAATSAEAAVERGERVPFNVRTDWGGYGPAYKHLLDD